MVKEAKQSRVSLEEIQSGVRQPTRRGKRKTRFGVTDTGDLTVIKCGCDVLPFQLVFGPDLILSESTVSSIPNSDNLV
jgi:hypothetical protein